MPSHVTVPSARTEVAWTTTRHIFCPPNAGTPHSTSPTAEVGGRASGRWSGAMSRTAPGNSNGETSLWERPIGFMTLGGLQPRDAVLLNE